MCPHVSLIHPLPMCSAPSVDQVETGSTSAQWEGLAFTRAEQEALQSSMVIARPRTQCFNRTLQQFNGPGEGSQTHGQPQLPEVNRCARTLSDLVRSSLPAASVSFTRPAVQAAAYDALRARIHRSGTAALPHQVPSAGGPSRPEGIHRGPEVRGLRVWVPPFRVGVKGIQKESNPGGGVLYFDTRTHTHIWC